MGKVIKKCGQQIWKTIPSLVPFSKTFFKKSFSTLCLKKGDEKTNCVLFV